MLEVEDLEGVFYQTTSSNSDGHHRDGATPLCVASLNVHYPVVEALLQHRAAVDHAKN